MVFALLPHRLLGIGYSEVALETRHVFCRIALWDSVYPGHLCICDGNENGEKRNRFRSAKTWLHVLWRTPQHHDFRFLFLNFDTVFYNSTTVRRICQHWTNWTKRRELKAVKHTSFKFQLKLVMWIRVLPIFVAIIPLLTYCINCRLSWSWIPIRTTSKFKERKKTFLVSCFVLHKTWNLAFLCSDGKEMYKKVWCTCIVCSFAALFSVAVVVA